MKRSTMFLIGAAVVGVILYKRMKPRPTTSDMSPDGMYSASDMHALYGGV